MPQRIEKIKYTFSDILYTKLDTSDDKIILLSSKNENE